MKVLNMRFLLTAIAAVTCSAAALTNATAASNQSLLTAQQKELDKIAISLQKEPAVLAARDAVLKRWGEQRAGSTEDGKATLPGAIDEMVYHSLRAAAANDPVRPKVVWTLTPPYTLGKTKVTGSRFAGDNTDRIYRYAAVDPAYRYEIRGKRGPKPAQHEFSFEVSNAISLVSPPVVALYSKDVDVAADGSFVVTADNSPTNGRRNHVQLPEGARALLFRDTVPDWTTDYNQLAITRLDGNEKPARDRKELVMDAAAIVAAAGEGTIRLFDIAWKYEANEIKPFVRPYEWGVPGNVIAMNRFSLQADEALVITLLQSDANYLGIQITDAWSRSVDYWNHISSLSNRQARPNSDGSFTYVLSAKDPGVFNWLDSGGLRDGLILTRWELFAQPLPPGNADQLVREVRKVKLSDLASALPEGMAKVTPAERQQQLKMRAAEYAKRVALK